MHSSAVVFRKQAETPEGVERLSREAAILKSVAHPNVVELLGEHVGGEKASLRLAEVDAVQLRQAVLSYEDYGRVIMSAAVTLAHVHARGVTHNSIDATHVLVRSTDKTAVLCGFGNATFTSDEYSQSRDVIALARLLRSHVERNNDPLRARIDGAVDGHADLVLSLRSTADTAADGEMSALALAEALRQVLENSPVLRAPGQRPRLRFPWKVAVAIVIPLALVGGGVSLLSGEASKASAKGSTATSIFPACDPVGRDSIPVDTDGDGCPNEVYITNGVVAVDGERFAVGNPSDKLLTGDWHGTGVSTLALLRPSTGEVFVFDEWPTAGATAVPTLVSVVAGASDISDRHVGHHDVMIAKTQAGDIVVDPLAGAGTTSAVKAG